MDAQLRQTLERTARFYDARKVGDVGFLGFRRSTDLLILLACLPDLLDAKIIVPRKTRFLDLGCADGRVNVFLSYLTKISVGVEVDAWTLDDYAPLKAQLTSLLHAENLAEPPDNIFLFTGDSRDLSVHATIAQDAGVRFDQFDLFYTYLVMHHEFAELIDKKAKRGAVFLVYGLDKILPRYNGLRLLGLSPLKGVLGLYEKP